MAVAIPAYREPRDWRPPSRWRAWRCRRRGGHFGPTTAHVVEGGLGMFIDVCSECGERVSP